jgi:hypothetical protein
MILNKYIFILIFLILILIKTSPISSSFLLVLNFQIFLLLSFRARSLLEYFFYWLVWIILFLVLAEVNKVCYFWTAWWSFNSFGLFIMVFIGGTKFPAQLYLVLMETLSFVMSLSLLSFYRWFCNVIMVFLLQIILSLNIFVLIRTI